jgi:hypothetical protein
VEDFEKPLIHSQGGQENLPKGNELILIQRHLLLLLAHNNLKILCITIVINEGSSEYFRISFTSILLAFLVSDDHISKWFQENAEKRKLGTDDISFECGVG